MLWITKTFFIKPEYRFLVESTKIENASFLYNTVRSDVLKNVTRDFQNNPSFDRSAFFMTIIGNFERFQYFSFEMNLLKNENLFQNTGVLFLIESTSIENATFPYKTAM